MSVIAGKSISMFLEASKAGGHQAPVLTHLKSLADGIEKYAIGAVRW